MELKKHKNKIIAYGAGAVIGGVAGYLYWYFIGCQSGGCPITANYYSSVAAGVFVGMLLADSLADLLKKSVAETEKSKQ